MKAEFEGGVQIGGERLNNLRFADDTVLLCNSKEEITDMIQVVSDKSAERGLLLNVKKTKILVVDSNREDTSAFKEVDDFIYLGSTITNKGNSAPEIRRRLAMAREAVSKMGNIWRRRRVSLNLKLRVLWATAAFPIAIYGSESWTMQKADERQVDASEMWYYRRVLRIPWTERKLAWVLDKIGNRLMLRDVVRRR